MTDTILLLHHPHHFGSVISSSSKSSCSSNSTCKLHQHRTFCHLADNSLLLGCTIPDQHLLRSPQCCHPGRQPSYISTAAEVAAHNSSRLSSAAAVGHADSLLTHPKHLPQTVKEA
jgi:hypothetical protein